MYRGYVLVCNGENCSALPGSDRLYQEFQAQIKMAGLTQEIAVIQGGCEAMARAESGIAGRRREPDAAAGDPGPGNQEFHEKIQR